MLGAGTEPSALPRRACFCGPGAGGGGTVPAKLFYFFYYMGLNLNKSSLLRGRKPSPLSCFRAHSGAGSVPGAGTEEGAQAEVSRCPLGFLV